MAIRVSFPLLFQHLVELRKIYRLQIEMWTCAPTLLLSSFMDASWPKQRLSPLFACHINTASITSPSVRNCCRERGKICLSAAMALMIMLGLSIHHETLHRRRFKTEADMVIFELGGHTSLSPSLCSSVLRGTFTFLISRPLNCRANSPPESPAK